MNEWTWISNLALLLALMVACNESGTARKVSPAPTAVEEHLPEPPGGPPSCAEIAAHLLAALDMHADVHANVRGVKVSIPGETMRSGAEQAIGATCRDAAWSLETRRCALSWHGNILSERTKLAAACPGTVQ